MVINRQRDATEGEGARAYMAFEDVWAVACEAKGWLEREEAVLLYDLVENAEARGRVVEIGSYCGRSAMVMAAALPRTSQWRLACVDTFGGSTEHQPGMAYFDGETLDPHGRVDTLPIFEANLTRAGLLERVEPIVAFSLDAANLLKGPLSVLFLDANHAYRAVCADLAAWLPKLAGGGIIVLHDVGDWEGPTRAAADLLALGYQRREQRGTALALRKPC